MPEPVIASSPSESSLPPAAPEYILTVACPDRPGIVYAVSSYLVQHACTIVESRQFEERGAGWFFMRVQFRVLDAIESHGRLAAGFGVVAESFGMTWQMTPAEYRPRTLLMVSRFGHCLNDLLFRQRFGDLRIDVPAVVSNHTDFAGLAEYYGVPFVHVPVTRDTKPEAEAKLLALIEEHDVELVVLARYMQVLSPELTARLSGKAINIHHSFLPSFKGARPYQQAHQRGVKLIGATAHYVTEDLDEGPIIEQDVDRVDHAMSADQLSSAGRDVESRVLARAVQWHAERRVLLNGTRTVVFR